MIIKYINKNGQNTGRSNISKEIQKFPHKNASVKDSLFFN